MATSATFTTGTTTTVGVVAEAEFCTTGDPTALDKLLAHIPSLYQPRVNTIMNGVLSGWAEGDCIVLKQIPEFKDQLFVETADLTYLDRLGANVNVVRPEGVGMKDEDYRNLIPVMSYVPKQIRKPIHRLLEIWYKDEAVYANLTSGAAEPYDLSGVVGGELEFTIDGTETVSIEIRNIDYEDVSAATAAEIALSINKLDTSGRIVAKSRKDSSTKLNHLNVRTTTYGPTGRIKVSSGSVQAILSFSTDTHTLDDIQRPAVLYEVNNGEVIVVLPSSPPIVSRDLEGAHYFHPDATTGDWPGPYLFDSDAEFSISGIETTTAQQINGGTVLTNIQTTAIPDDFPTDGGHFILDFGVSTQEGPIKYISIPNDNNIIVDPTYVFKKTHPSGTDIKYVRSLRPPKIEADGTDYSSYVTGLAAARNALQDLIREVVASGIVIRFVVLFPEYKFSNESLNTNEAI